MNKTEPSKGKPLLITDYVFKVSSGALTGLSVFIIIFVIHSSPLLPLIGLLGGGGVGFIYAYFSNR